MNAAVSFGKAPFTLKTEEKYVLISLNGDLDGNVAKEFEKKISGLLQENKNLFFDFTECSGIHPAWTRILLSLVRELKVISKSLRFIAVNSDIQRGFADQGIGGTIKYSVSIATALADLDGAPSPAAAGSTPSASGKKIDVKFVNAFLDAVIKVMKIQTQTEVKAGTPYLKSPKDGFTGDISGVIGLVSDAFNGTIVINFPEGTFLGIISRMLGESFTVLTPEISDGAAELTNIIFGQAKVTLNELGYGIKMATPSVVSGKNHTISNTSSGPRVTVPFESDLGKFTVEICLT